ncbi:MAG: hypothetical protein IKS22_00130 [Bacteroidales bacterium]|nr:hypothetical protein [Bacteroidales bacterium]
MHYNIITLALLQLFTVIPCCGQGHKVITRNIPQLECTNKKIQDEITFYLNQYNNPDKTTENCFWNLLCLKEKSDKQVTYIVYKDEQLFPSLGSGYIEHGDDIIIVSGKYDKHLFNKKTSQKIITMQERTTPRVINAPFIEIVLNNEKLITSQVNFNISSDTEYTDDYFQSLRDMFNWVKNGEDENIIVCRNLPQVKCKNKILENIIVDYLNLYPETAVTKYWNISITKPFAFPNENVYNCIVSKERSLPDIGTAYIEIGKNILVLQEEIDESIFTYFPGKEQSVSMIKNRVPEMRHSPYILVQCTNDRLIKMKYEYSLNSW